MYKNNTLSCLLFATTIILAMMGYHLWTEGQRAPAAAATEPIKAKEGVVKGIFYTEDNPSAVLGGRIVHEGDMVGGVKVLKIQTNKIEFEKNGSRWSQEVQEKPSPKWKSKD